MSLPFLETIGLTNKEAAIYELLLRKGEMSVGEIIKEVKLKRATVYKSLYELEKKKLVTKKVLRKKIHFKPEPPTQLLEIAEDKLKEQERARTDLRTILPELTSTYITTVEKPVVTTYEGVEGLKQIYEDTLKEGKPIFAILNTTEVEPGLFKWLTHYYVKERAKKGIYAQVIISSGKWAKEYENRNNKEERKTIEVPYSLFPFQHEVDIYGDKVAFVNYKRGEALIGIIINHPQIARTMKALFDLAWKGGISLDK